VAVLLNANARSVSESLKRELENFVPPEDLFYSRCFADARGIALLDLAFAGLLAQPAVGSVIAGATKPEQVRANVAAGERELSPEDVEALRALP